MSSGAYNIKIDQGAKYFVRFTWTDNLGVPIDVTGWTGQIMFRNKKEDAAPIYDSSINGDVIVGDNDGLVDFELDTADTAAFTFDNALYDLELTDLAGEVTRLLEGRVYLNKEVTR